MTERYVIICRGFADDRPCIAEGLFLHGFDADAENGRGMVSWTKNLDEARTMGRIDAMKLFMRQSTVRPFRDDGEPNRPLTAFNIEIVTKQIAQKEMEDESRQGQ